MYSWYRNILILLFRGYPQFCTGPLTIVVSICWKKERNYNDTQISSSSFANCICSTGEKNTLHKGCFVTQLYLKLWIETLNNHPWHHIFRSVTKLKEKRSRRAALQNPKPSPDIRIPRRDFLVVQSARVFQLCFRVKAEQGQYAQ